MIFSESRFTLFRIMPRLLLMWNLGLEIVAIHPDSGNLAPEFLVMAGLVPAIHVFFAAEKGRRGCPAQGRA
jgi:hypothetical protein